MENVIVGYYIGHHVQFDFIHRRLVNIDKRKCGFIKEHMLRDTMNRLLLFLLQNANNQAVQTSDVLYHVWDVHGLSSSNQRLWQVMQSLQFRLLSLNVPHDFVSFQRTIKGKGIYLNGDMIKPYYFHFDKNIIYR